MIDVNRTFLNRHGRAHVPSATAERRGRIGRGRAMLGRLLLPLLLGTFLVSCSSDPVPTDAPLEPIHLFDDDLGLGFEVVPNTIDTGRPNSIRVTATPMYSGTGYFVLECPDNYGEVLSPVTSGFGRVRVAVHWEAGTSIQLTWLTQFYDTPDLTFVGLVASMDSLDLDAGRFSVIDPEAVAVVGASAGTELYRRIAIERR
jgi:hypothetical protein